MKGSYAQQPDLQTVPIDFPIMQLPTRTGVQALLLLEIEAILFRSILQRKKLQLTEHQMKEPVDILDRIENPPGSTSFFDETTISDEEHFIISSLLNDAPLGYVNIVESTALYLRCRVESLLIRYEILNSLSPLPPGASLLARYKRNLKTVGMHKWEIPTVSTQVFDSHYLRINECYEEAERLAKEVLTVSEDVASHLRFKLNETSNIEDGYTSVETYRQERLATFWNRTSGSSVLLFKGIVWVPFSICASCLSLRTRTDFWRNWVKEINKPTVPNPSMEETPSVELIEDDTPEIESSEMIQHGSKKSGPFFDNELEILDFLLCNLKRMVHLSQSINIAAMAFGSTYQSDQFDPYFTSYPPLQHRAPLLRNCSVLPMQKMEAARLKFLLIVELAHQHAASSNGSQVEYLSRAWMVAGLFMWDGISRSVELGELCSKYETLRNALDSDAVKSLGLPAQSIKERSNSICSILTSLLLDIEKLVPQRLTVDDIRRDCLKGVSTLIDKHG